MWYMNTTEHYVSRKTDKVLIHAMVWTNLDNIMPHARTQAQ